MRGGNLMWLKFDRVHVEGSRDPWNRKVKNGGDRARERVFVVLRFPKGQ